MIIKIRRDAAQAARQQLLDWLRAQGLEASLVEGTQGAVYALLGDTARVDIERVRARDIVEEARRIHAPYPRASRTSHPRDTVVCAGGARVGGGHFALISGPCSVESEAQILAVARAAKAAGATHLRGGAFKPRTSPYAFSGLEAEGIRLLLRARAETGLPVVSEIMEAGQIPLFDAVDIIQVGARNMQNYALLRALGELRKPVLIKRGLSSTVEELLMSAEYVLAGGNAQVILCERGIRTFETSTRNTLDLSAVPVLKALTHLPVIVDPSHGVGVAALVPPMALAAVAAGADGVMIEVHNDPQNALSDGRQAIAPDALGALVRTMDRVRRAIGQEKGVRE